MNTKKVHWVDVTPTLAERWLNNKNIHNRLIRERLVEQYALDMKRGNWGKTHQAIAFDENGDLIDGQHRLAAIMRSGKTINFLIVQDLPTTQTISTNGISSQIATQLLVDQGAKRTAGDQLSLVFNLENSALKASIVANIAALAKGHKITLSVPIIKQVYDIYASEIEAICKHKKNTRWLGNSPVLAIFAIAARCYRNETLEFENHYFSGEDLKKDSPILAFRNFMLNRGGGDYSRVRIQAITIMSHGANCLMRYILHEPLKVLRTTAQGVNFFASKQKKTFTEIAELIRL
ncbi:MAG: hypothetical protein KKB31_01330 [Nanoarchaeota archaeon]|nr:hypothetical protein [Nanoarchaeota archaeon]